MSKHRGTVTSQQLFDSGLNVFAVQMLAKSINGHGQKEKLRKPLSFAYDDVVFTFSLMPDQEWTEATLVEILGPIAAIENVDTFLVRFARAFCAAEHDERTWLVHVALMLVDRYSLWPYVAPIGTPIRIGDAVYDRVKVIADGGAKKPCPACGREVGRNGRFFSAHKPPLGGDPTHWCEGGQMDFASGGETDVDY